MNHLRRELSPVLPAAFREIEAQAAEALTTYLAARKLVDFDGPHAWQLDTVKLGLTRVVPTPVAGAELRVRRSLPLVELRVPFELTLEELDRVERGALDLELEPVVEAARKLALAEDHTVFYGLEAAEIGGIAPSSPHEPVDLVAEFQEFPALISEAIARLHEAGVSGPYAIALDAPAYTGLLRATGQGGYPVLQHVSSLVQGPTVWAPALHGALVMSLRGGDFELTVGQDVAIGYFDHRADKVQLYLEETFTFRVLNANAAVALPRRQL